MTTSTLLSDTDASAYLGGIRPKTLKNWRSAGEGPSFIKVGRSVRYSVADLDQYLAASRVERLAQ